MINLLLFFFNQISGIRDSVSEVFLAGESCELLSSIDFRMTRLVFDLCSHQECVMISVCDEANIEFAILMCLKMRLCEDSRCQKDSQD